MKGHADSWHLWTLVQAIALVYLIGFAMVLLAAPSRGLSAERWSCGRGLRR
jgi:hypothetical protein